MKAKALLGIGLLVVTYLAFGCHDQGLDAGQVGQVETMLTSVPTSSSPFVPETDQILAAAEVTVVRAYLIPAGGLGAGQVEIFSSESGTTFDLFDLQNGLQTELSLATVPAGKYEQVRIVISEARVTLAEGYRFSDGSTTQVVEVPSAEQVGISVLLRNDFVVPENGLVTLVLNLDLSRNFHIQMDPNSENVVRRVVFTPVIQEHRIDKSPA